MSPSHFARALWTCPQPSTRRPDPGQVLGASCAPRRKSQQAEREYEKIKSQLEGLEESVRDRCKKEFTGEEGVPPPHPCRLWPQAARLGLLCPQTS